MLFKLAWNNVKKNLRDFIIYFITLTFGICLFYTSNALSSQKEILILSDNQSVTLDDFQKLMTYLSVLCAIILGFLIVYANQFLIKRRKKELGIYMLLGMEKMKVSFIIILETLVIGFFALVYGLLFGVLCSQVLAVITAKILGTNIKDYKFILSEGAFIYTIICFVIIFIIVIIFNGISISRNKLIDLLTANKKNQTYKMRKLWVSVILFILSLFYIAIAYYFLLAMNFNSIEKIICAASLLYGTYLFFKSLSGIILKVTQANKKLYYKGLNLFIFRQISSKIMNTYVLMTVICFMLFLFISSFSGGANLSYLIKYGTIKNTPYDLTINDFSASDDSNNNSNYMIDLLEQNGMDFKDLVSDFQILNSYDLNVKYDQLLKYYRSNTSDARTYYFMKKLNNSNVEVLPLSEFNNNLMLQGKTPITLKENEYAVCSSYSDLLKNLNKYIQNKDTIMIKGKQFTMYPKVLSYNFYDFSKLAIIIQDKELEGEAIVRGHLNIQFKDNAKQTSKTFINKMNRVYYEKERPFDQWIYKNEIREENFAGAASASYATIYVGIMFLISCSTILALQQLAENIDNVERYKLLSKLGVEKKDINKSIFIQIFIYFMAPLSLAIIHSYVIINIFNSIVSNANGILSNIPIEILASAIGIIIIYCGYILAAYLSCKKMVK